jgi:hypothetical protein
MPSPRPGYMHESTSRALGLWLMWFMTEVREYVCLSVLALRSHAFRCSRGRDPARDHPDARYAPPMGFGIAQGQFVNLPIKFISSY